MGGVWEGLHFAVLGGEGFSPAALLPCWDLEGVSEEWDAWDEGREVVLFGFLAGFEVVDEDEEE